MKSITFATTNKGKVATVNRQLHRFGIDVMHEYLEIPEIRSDSVEEISSHKVRYAFEKLKKPVIALDSGFFIKSLNGFPRAYVNFALDTIGVDGILKLVAGLEPSAAFHSALAYMDETLSEPKVFTGTTSGTIAARKRGQIKEQSWSELHYIFVPDGYSKTIAEMTVEEFNDYADKVHDGPSYLNKFAKWYNNR